MPGLTLKDQVRSSVIHKGLIVESLLLHIKRSQSRCFRHVVRMPFGKLAEEVFQTCSRDYVSWLALKHLGYPCEDLEEVVLGHGNMGVSA